MRKDKFDKGLVYCSCSGEWRPGWVVCTHVLRESAPIAYRKEYEPDRKGAGAFGHIACSKPPGEHTNRELAFVCGHCLANMGILKN